MEALQLILKSKKIVVIELIVVEVKKSMFTYEHLVEGCGEAAVDMESI